VPDDGTLSVVQWFSLGPVNRPRGRYRTEGEPGLRDRSSAPRGCPHRTSQRRVEAIAALRRVRVTGPEIAECLDMSLWTASGILTRTGMGKLGRFGLEPAIRYERERPGELIHIDIERLGRSREARAANSPETPPASSGTLARTPSASSAR
jgi:hypothetical protein